MPLRLVSSLCVLLVLAAGDERYMVTTTSVLRCLQAAGAALAKLAKAEKVASAGLALLSAPQGADAQQEAAKRLAAGGKSQRLLLLLPPVYFELLLLLQIEDSLCFSPAARLAACHLRRSWCDPARAIWHAQQLAAATL